MSERGAQFAQLPFFDLHTIQDAALQVQLHNNQPDLLHGGTYRQDLGEQAVAGLAGRGVASIHDVRYAPPADRQRTRNLRLRFPISQQRLNALLKLRFRRGLFVHPVQHALDTAHLAFDAAKSRSGLLRESLIGHAVCAISSGTRPGAACLTYPQGVW